MKSPIIGVRLTPSVDRQIRLLAKSSGITITDIVRESLHRYLVESEKAKALVV